MSEKQVVDRILVLPDFLEKEGSSTGLYRFISLHMKIHRTGCQKNSPLIVPLVYVDMTPAEIIQSYEENNNVIPESSLYHLLGGENADLQAGDLSKRIQEMLQYVNQVKRLEQSAGMHSPFHADNLPDHFRLLGKRMPGAAKDGGKVPVLAINGKAELSLDDSHIPEMGRQDDWVLQLIRFFWAISAGHFVINAERLSYDAFLFTAKGKLAAFIDYGLLTSYPAAGNRDDAVNEHNLRAFANLLSLFWDYYARMPSEEMAAVSHYDSRFQKLQDRLKDPNEIGFSSFKEVFSYFVNQEEPAESTNERIGIFLDAANIYTDLQDLEVDYRRLFTFLYGMERKKYIKDRFAVFFQPEYESKAKTEAFGKWQNVLIRKLEEQGFEIILAGNEKAKAKQIVGGKVHDADDNKLIQRMEERMERLTEILLFTGDKDFYGILEKYKNSGRRVKVISTHPDSTSNRIRESFDHSYITDYWDCINF